MPSSAASRSVPRLRPFLLAIALAFGGTASVGQEAQDPHAAHRRALEKKPHYTREVLEYQLPEVTLVDQSGAQRPLGDLVRPDHPLALNFIFTTCTTICPVMTATFRGMLRELGDERGDLRLVSVSIDPEYDTPEVLEGYAARFGSPEGWDFVTGSMEDVVAVEKAFDAYAGSKTNHRALTFFKARGSDRWVRIDGLASAADLAREYRDLVP